MREYILAINPGSTSTKIGIFKEKNKISEEKINHDQAELQNYKRVSDQFEPRLNKILSFLSDKYELESLRAVVGRGGLLRPIPRGTYLITDYMLKDLIDGYSGEHASNLGGQLASRIASMAGTDAYIVDPVIVDEMDEVAKLSGMPQIERKSVFHALNIGAVANRVAEKKGFKLENENIIAVHMGGGFSVCAMKKGKCVDVTNSMEGGSFTPERTGSLPMTQLIKMCYSGKYTYDEMRKLLVGQGGMVAYLGTNDCVEALKRASLGDKKAELVINAMIYHLSKQIGGMAAALEGEVKYILITGGVAYNKQITKALEKRISFIAPVIVEPGDDELSAMNEGVLRVLNGKEKVKIYENEINKQPAGIV